MIISNNYEKALEDVQRAENNFNAVLLESYIDYYENIGERLTHLQINLAIETLTRLLKEMKGQEPLETELIKQGWGLVFWLTQIKINRQRKLDYSNTIPPNHTRININKEVL